MLRLPEDLSDRVSARLRHPGVRVAGSIVLLSSCLVVAQVAWGTNRGTIEPITAQRVRVALAPVTVSLPPVEPLTFRSVAPDTARAINAATPFVAAANPPAKPYRFKSNAAEEEKAITCLAAAAWYEAGDDTPGEQAVIQVVLNRLRHPVFPKSVCGVVFQGAERTSGCQFTFSCDGAMVRKPSAAAWLRARLLARLALHGAVYAQVGWATHYHTEAVVPYWSATLDKNAKVGTHIFFRWHGGWGEAPAFTGSARGEEQLDPRLVGYTKAKLAAGPAPLAMAIGDDSLSLAGAEAPQPPVPEPAIAEATRGSAATVDTQEPHIAAH